MFGLILIYKKGDEELMVNKVKGVTSRIIKALYGNGNLDKAVLASIRSAATITSPRAQKVWPVLMANLDEDMLSKTGAPTYAENAIYTAIRLYAVCQQGKTEFMCGSVNNEEAPGRTLFGALADLRKREDIRVALDRRVQALLETTNISGVINAITHLVEILKSHNVSEKIDFPLLAEELYWFQFSFEQANQVRLFWGQQYFRSTGNLVNSEGK